MKAFTDLEQSKKLAKILSIESADMCWCNKSIKGVNYVDNFSANLYTVKEMKDVFDTALNGWDKYWELIPCWSLAALVNILRKDFEVCIIGYEKAWKCHVTNRKTLVTDWLLADNPIDCCYEMILKLHELKML